jgi:hypothetical protein
MQPVVTEQAQDVSPSQAPSGPHLPCAPSGPHIFGQAASSTTAVQQPVQQPDNTVADCGVQAQVPVAASVTTDSVSPAPSPSHQQQRAQSNRKLVCCLACESKRLAKRNPDIIMAVSEAELAQGIETTRACPDFDFLSIDLSVCLSRQLASDFPSPQNLCHECVTCVVARSRAPTLMSAAGFHACAATQHSRLRRSSSHTRLCTPSCSRFAALSAIRVSHAATACEGTSMPYMQPCPRQSTTKRSFTKTFPTSLTHLRLKKAWLTIFEPVCFHIARSYLPSVLPSIRSCDFGLWK